MNCIHEEKCIYHDRDRSRRPYRIVIKKSLPFGGDFLLRRFDYDYSGKNAACDINVGNGKVVVKGVLSFSVLRIILA